LDDKVVDFINFLEAQGSLKDTIILLQSDHGVNMPGFYTFVDAEDFWIEKTLPSLFLMVPQEVAEKYDDVLKSKENILLHPYDLHNTFLHLANAPMTSYNDIGESLFDETDDSKERTCDTFNVLDPYCICMGQRGNP
jgi:arylsulfatase A-like enzyme